MSEEKINVEWLAKTLAKEGWSHSQEPSNVWVFCKKLDFYNAAWILGSPTSNGEPVDLIRDEKTMGSNELFLEVQVDEEGMIPLTKQRIEFLEKYLGVGWRHIL